MGSESDKCSPSRFNNTLEVKSLIYQKIGHSRANTYLDQLAKFLTSRISKSEFDKLCIKTIGREHVSLHNRLLRSILKNATVSKSPPPPRFLKKSLNGDSAFPPSSTRKCRSRKFRDRPSPLGPLGKPQSITTTTNDESVLRLPMEEGEEVEQSVQSSRSSGGAALTAPLGVSFTRGDRKFVCREGESCQNSSELPDTVTLKSRLERRLEMEGITLSSMDSANVLNSGLDAFVARLIKPCLSLVRRKQRVSMSDLRVAMELNPRVLGEDWPIHLEKVCSRASEE